MEQFGQAGELSRLPTKSTELFDLYYLGVNQVVNLVIWKTIPNLPIDSAAVTKEAAKDVELRQLTCYITYGWTDKVDVPWRSYVNRKNEYSLRESCAIWSEKLVIPKRYREAVLSYLHGIHVGIVRRKAEARSYCWWPGMDRMLEELAAKCRICSLASRTSLKNMLRQ